MLGLASTCAIVVPQLDEQLLPPVIAPTLVPVVHVNVLLALDVSPIDVATPLQLDAVAALVTAGVGCTVFTTLNADPTQPNVDVGVTRY